jgi:hypothetical protein
MFVHIPSDISDLIQHITFTALFLDLCAREEISPTSTVLEANLSMDEHFQMRTLTSGTGVLVLYPWLTLVLTLMDLNSSFVQLILHGSMESTLFSGR